MALFLLWPRTNPEGLDLVAGEPPGGVVSLVDDINAIAAHGCCTTGVWYAQQEKDDQAAFNAYVEAIKTGEGRYKDLYDVCVKHGLEISKRSFRDHITQHHESR